MYVPGGTKDIGVYVPKQKTFLLQLQDSKFKRDAGYEEDDFGGDLPEEKRTSQQLTPTDRRRPRKKSKLSKRTRKGLSGGGKRKRRKLSIPFDPKKPLNLVSNLGSKIRHVTRSFGKSRRGLGRGFKRRRRQRGPNPAPPPQPLPRTRRKFPQKSLEQQQSEEDPYPFQKPGRVIQKLSTDFLINSLFPSRRLQPSSPPRIQRGLPPSPSPVRQAHPRPRQPLRAKVRQGAPGARIPQEPRRLHQVPAGEGAEEAERAAGAGGGSGGNAGEREITYFKYEVSMFCV